MSNSQYTIEPCNSGEWYFVTDNQWIEGGDMSESTARAIAKRLNWQAAEIERMREAVEFLRSQANVEQITALDSRKCPPCWQGEAAWWPVRVWEEFERRMSG